MAKIKYLYNTETCKYEPIETTSKKFIINLLSFIGVALVMAIGMIYFYQANFTPYKETKLSNDNYLLKSKWGLLRSELEKADYSLTELQIKDDGTYRTILDISPIPSSAREVGIGGSPRFQNLLSDNLIAEDLIVDTYKKVDKIKKRTFIQTLSYDELVRVEMEKEKMWASQPAIQPISNTELTRLHTTYGQRFHPVLNIWRPHKALDFTAPKGTAVYATGDGVIQRAAYSKSYGNVVYIDHGYDYKTRYAHLTKFIVKRGQIVKRGDIIGYVGNTGLSEASHLHYEVLYKNEQINPIDYFHRDLSVEEYEKLVNLSDDTAPILDSN